MIQNVWLVTRCPCLACFLNTIFTTKLWGEARVYLLDLKYTRNNVLHIKIRKCKIVDVFQFWINFWKVRNERGPKVDFYRLFKNVFFGQILKRRRIYFSRKNSLKWEELYILAFTFNTLNPRYPLNPKGTKSTFWYSDRINHFAELHSCNFSTENLT